ncbi:MAG TPA: CotH kinase family protein [Planctomycetota bacterium]|nr:CotH kinase family protein [Planctomycetota bacterium]
MVWRVRNMPAGAVPLAAGSIALCAALHLGAQVVINEIHYHPRAGAEEDEFIEVHNAGSSAVDIAGWSFGRGVDFVFPAGASIPAGGHVIVALNADRLREKHALPDALVFGNYSGMLSNGGETLELSDARGDFVDRVEYLDEFPWPAEADGLGPSIECIDPGVDNNSPRNWLSSANRSTWVLVAVEGKVTSNRLFLYLEGAGECLIDAITITELGSSSNIFPEGDFEAGFAGWSATGTHSASGVTAADAFSGSASLHLKATGAGSGLERSVHRVIDSLTPGASYRLEFRAKPLSGNSSLLNRVTGGGLLARTELRRLEGTPGRENSARGSDLPPLIAHFGVDPSLPPPGTPVLLTAIIEEETLGSAGAVYDLGDGPREIPLRDDGLEGDPIARDGAHSAWIPGAPRGAIVDFRVFAVDTAGQRVETPVRRYPVADFNVASNLPVYQIFIRPTDWQKLNANIWTEEYSPAVFVHDGEVFTDVGLRFRGGRPRLFRKKSLKLSFSNEHPFGGKDRVNLNAAAMDDDYVTEPLAYWLYERAGLEASRTRFVRVELNGEFWGLFIDVEQVDERYLERHGLDPEGALYKAVGIVGSLRKLDGVLHQGQSYTYESQYEKKTREEEPYTDLIDFIHALHTTPRADMEAHLDAHLEVEQYINYLAISNLMCVWDNMQHNFYFHRDTPGSGKWRVIPWDLDHAWGEWEWNYYFNDTYHLFMGTRSHPFAGVWYTWNQLWTTLLDVPRYRDMYVERVGELLNTRFAEGPVLQKLDELVSEIEATVALDEAKWRDSAEPLHTGPRRTMAQEVPLLKQNFTRRRQHMARTLGIVLKDIPARSPFLRGDVDGDLAVTLADAMTLIWRLFLGGGSLDCDAAGDTDDSGRVDVADALMILRYVFQGGAQPPAPGPAICGQDPTDDTLDCFYSTCE